MWKIFTAALLSGLLFYTPAQAGDIAGLEFYGFSKDGKYLAFEQYGINDGSGIPYSEIFFLNVDKNAYASKPLIFDDEANRELGLEQVRKKNSLLAQPKLKELGIGGTQDKLLHVVSHSFYDMGVDPHKVSFRTFFQPMLRLEPGLYPPYEITLQERKINKSCAGLGSAQIFTVTLRNIHSKANKVLQKDKSLPSSRGCPLGYRIQDVYVYLDKLVLFVGMFTPGFEGPNMRYLGITGNFE